MKQHSIKNNNYFIFKTNKQKGFIHFLWGKFDFKVTLVKVDKETAEAKEDYALSNKQSEYYIVENLKHLHANKWYHFVGVTSHGFTFEETEWKLDGDKLWFEFPSNLYKVAVEIASLELAMDKLTE